MADLLSVAKGLPRTVPAYWEDSYKTSTECNVLRFAHDEKKYWYLVFERTIFHPKGGGQPSDRGMAEGQGFKFEVKKAMLTPGPIVVHWGKLVDGTPTEELVRSTIDWGWRFLLMRRHTAAHLLDHCLAEAVGSSVEASGSWLGDPCYVEYKGETPTREQLERAEAVENSFISNGALVRSEELDVDKARRTETSLSNVQLPAGAEQIRFVTIEGCKPIACGGTHLRNVSEAKGIRLGRLEPVEGGFRVHFEVA